jgi:hypothetical protein
MFRRMGPALVLMTAVPALGFGAGLGSSGEVPLRPAAEGTLRPVGRPGRPPVRTDAGGACVVDLVQDYTLSGTLSGSATIDYRILVHGPCGAPPGTFPEEWIAHGQFSGTLSGTDTAASFTYVARVVKGGQVGGEIVLGSKLDGKLKVSGRFSDGRLSYTGWARPLN